MRLRVLILSVAAALGAPVAAASANGGPIMPLSQIQPGMDCTGETVIQGTTISSFDVHVINIVQDPQFGPRILVSVSGPAVAGTGIAEGFSGSPVYCPASGGSLANAGALSSVLPDIGNDVGEVTPIQQMLGELVIPPASAARLTARSRPLLGPLTIGGLSPAMLNLVRRAVARVGRVVVAAPARASASYPVQPLVPGASVAASYATGAVTVGAAGTVTYRDGANVYAFGHELDGAGRRALVLEDAFVYDVINNPIFGSFKLVVPGNTEGTLTSDTPNAIIGVVGPPPPLVPVHVTARDLDTGGSISLDTQVADETDIGLPLGSSLVDGIAPLEAGQAATQVYDGPPANESGRMCVQIYLRERRAPLGFCNRYVGTGTAGDAGVSPPLLALATSTDMSTAFGLLEQVQFAALHVTRVVARISAQRGLAEASIVSASAPFHVLAGKRVTVRLRVRMFRGALRTVSFKLLIPRGINGSYQPVLHGPPLGPPPAPPGGLLNVLGGVLGGAFGFGPSGPPPEPPPPPSNLAQLASEIAGIGFYDGLVVGSHGRGTRPVYRDPSIVIAGRVQLAFAVR
jgi:hypothetical protein